MNDDRREMPALTPEREAELEQCCMADSVERMQAQKPAYEAALECLDEQRAALALPLAEADAIALAGLRPRIGLPRFPLPQRYHELEDLAMFLTTALHDTMRARWARWLEQIDTFDSEDPEDVADWTAEVEVRWNQAARDLYATITLVEHVRHRLLAILAVEHQLHAGHAAGWPRALLRELDARL